MSLLCLRCKLSRSLKILAVFYMLERCVERENPKIRQCFCLPVLGYRADAEQAHFSTGHFTCFAHVPVAGVW